MMMLAGLLMMQTATAQVKESVNSGAWQQKVSPLLCMQISQAKMASHRASGKETYLGALVKVAEGQNGQVLTKEGTLLLDSLDQFYIALLPASRIQTLAEKDDVEIIEAHEKGTIQMDVTHQTIGADKVQAGTPSLNIPAYTGKGVVVGITDIGFDYTHPMFRNADGTMAIKKAWDAFAENTNGFGGLGTIYETKDEMLAAQGSKDHAVTHGTHVMGIAAGRPWKAFNWENKEVTYQGIAYEADIIAATTGARTGIPQIDMMMADKLDNIKKEGAAAEVLDANITGNDIYSMLALKMVFDYAKEHNQPCVANCSWGSHMLFTARYTATDQFMGKLIGPGRIIVASSGNDGDSQIYAEKPDGQQVWYPYTVLKDSISFFTMHSDEEFTFDLDIYNMTSAQPRYYLDPSLTSEFIRQSADQKMNAMIWEYTNSSGVTQKIKLEYGYIKNDTKGYDYEFDFYFPSEFYEKELKGISLKLTSEGKIRLIGKPGRMLFEGKNNFCNPYTVGWPGASPNTLCVGITSHRDWVTNIYGKETYASGRINTDPIVNWSACGPTLDGRMKPELVAPGYNLVSARSKLYSTNTEEWNDDSKLVVASNKDGDETREVVLESGTSMSAPVMTGVVALWLQAKPTLTKDEILQTLSRTAKKLDASLTYPNNTFGYGEVDAYAGLLDILGINTSIPTLSNKLANITMKGRTLYIDGAVEPITVNVYSINGQLVFSAVANDGTVTLPQLPAAVYAVQAGTLGSSLIRL